MSLSNISNYLKYDPTSSTFLRWVKTRAKNTKVGDEAGFLALSTYRIKFENKFYFSSQIIYYLHHGILPEKIKYLDGNRQNLSIGNLISSEKKQKRIRKEHEFVNSSMKQPEITPDTRYTWIQNKNMINLLNENSEIVRKFKNPFVQDEEFIGNVRWEIILRFGINPKLLKEKE
jgi:hypothetical protein